jgi:glycosyltransferase involved in cell wall biosynthesis
MISGAALVVQRLAQGMVRRGHSVMVLGASDRGQPYEQGEAGVRVARLRAVPNPARVGQRFVLWPGRALAERLRAFQPDVIHLHDPLQIGLAGLQAARRLRVPAVLTVHAMPGLAAAYAPPVPGLRWVIQVVAWSYGTWLAKLCQGIVVPSRVMADLIAERTGLRAHVIGNGVDLQCFHPQAAPGEADALRARYGLSPELPIILYVGRLDVEKRSDLVLRAAAGPVRAGQAQLVLSGDGRQRRGLERLAERLGIRQQTHFTGFVTQGDDLAGLYRLATAFAIASEVETQGVAVLEAAASGLPVVTVRATAMPELVEHGVSGYLAAPGDHAAMGAHLSALLAQPRVARAMGLAGREKMAQSHSHTLTLDLHDELYLSAGARRHATPLPPAAERARVPVAAEISED